MLWNDYIYEVKYMYIKGDMTGKCFLRTKKTRGIQSHAWVNIHNS